MAIQLNFDCIGLTESELEAYCVAQKVKLLEAQLANVRRGLFKRHSELEKELIRCKEEIIELTFRLKKVEVNNTMKE